MFFVLLSSLSESSDENMMDAHNLSVCFGPTLMPMPPDHDQVRNQNYVNELIRILIVYHEKIFPADTGIVYDKCMVEEDGQVLLISVFCRVVCGWCFYLFCDVSKFLYINKTMINDIRR